MSQNQITSSSRNWNLSTGIFKYNNILKIKLPQNDTLLQADHGIYNPLADLKSYFPKADIFPVLIGQKTTDTQLQLLLNKIQQSCGFDCLLVASVDFSHYFPATLAEVHDAFTINNLQNLDTQNILKSEVDSPQSLYLLSSFARYKNASKWTLFDHTNSGYITHNPDYETVTHVFGSYSRGSIRQSTLITSTSITPNFSISSIITSDQIIRSFLPIKNSDYSRGFEKQEKINTYFDLIDESSCLHKDYFWGKLIYERNCTTFSN